MANLSRRYELHEELGRGSMGTVMRATDHLLGEQVAIKQVAISTQQLMFTGSQHESNSTVALAQEFQLLASLRHPNIISVLDYGFNEANQPYFTMSLLQNPQNVLVTAFPRDVGGKVDLLVQILQALAYLHRRGILHRDLKPANVLVVDEQVKVLDFGLAIRRDHLSTQEQNIVGTMLYIAPEVILSKPPTEAADLYAVGVIAYEMFANRHPFIATNYSQFIQQVLQDQPDITQVDAPQAVQAIIARLLQKDPATRYQDALTVIDELLAAVGLAHPTESTSIRESFLQAAQFVGRNAEFAQLSTALSTMLATQQGALWLIGGESGIGKSRLLDELRPYALAQGALVLRGQTVSEGGASYLLWRDILRHIVFHVELMAGEASILKTIVPDLPNLLQIEIPNAPEVDPKTAQNRLLKVIEDVFRRAQRPLVILLEDLQWAGESLEILKRLASHAPHLPWLIIGTYRDDEAPHLHEEYPNAKRILLSRLAPTTIGDLSASMLGDQVGRDPKLIEFLAQQTEGNIFFIVEVVRTLAEEAGQLAQIGQMTLPERIMAGGMQTVIQKRLSRVPQTAIPLLHICAVVGRDIDLALLVQLGDVAKLDEWLSICAENAVLDVQDNVWRFAHDKIREAMLDALPSATKQALHLQVAEGLQVVHPDDPTYTSALAYHYTAAQQPTLAHTWTMAAGEQALRNGVLIEAAHHFEQASQLQTQFPLPQAIQARTYRLLARVLLGLGQIAESRQASEKALKLVGYTMPENRLRLVAGIVGQSLRQMAYLVNIPVPQRHKPAALTLEALKSSRILGEVYVWSGYQLPTAYTNLLGLNLAAEVGASDLAIRNYLGASYFLSLSPFKRIVPLYLRRARAMVEESQNPTLRSDYLYGSGLVLLHEGKFKQANTAFGEARLAAKTVSDDQRYIINTAQYMATAYYLGDYHAGLAHAEEMEHLARQQQNLQYLVWALGGEAAIAIHRGQYDLALRQLTEAIDGLVIVKDALAKVYIYGQLASLQWRMGNLDAAEQAAEKIYRGVTTKRSSGHAGLEGYPALIEVYMALWRTATNPPQRDEFAQKTQAVLKAMRKYAQLFICGRPRALFWQGMWDYQQGQVRDAEQTWQKMLGVARHFEMRYEQSLALWQLGKTTPAHREQAQAIWTDLAIPQPKILIDWAST